MHQTQTKQTIELPSQAAGPKGPILLIVKSHFTNIRIFGD